MKRFLVYLQLNVIVLNLLVENYASFFSCTPVGRASGSMMAGASCLLFGPPGFNWCFSFGVIRRPGISIVGQITESVESSFLIHRGNYHDLCVCP